LRISKIIIFRVSIGGTCKDVVDNGWWYALFLPVYLFTKEFLFNFQWKQWWWWWW
jgi:hypothetical protein